MDSNRITMIGFLFCFGLVMLLTLTVIVDSLTIKEIGEESVPCKDKYDRPFEDEMCTKTIYCSWLGFVSKERCVNVLLDETGSKNG